MAIALETLHQSEHYKLRLAYNRMLLLGAVLAIILHIVAAVVSPPYTPHPYQLRDRTFETIELPDNIVIPPPPDDVQRPELPQEAEISEEASEEETLAPTTYDPFAPPVVPQSGGGEADVFVAFDTPPEPVHMVPAVYPDLARQAEAEGVVSLLVTIDETGRVTEVTVHSSNTIAALDKAAIDAARKWLFKPAKQRDKPVKVRIIVPFRFSLN